MVRLNKVTNNEKSVFILVAFTVIKGQTVRLLNQLYFNNNSFPRNFILGNITEHCKKAGYDLTFFTFSRIVSRFVFKKFFIVMTHKYVYHKCRTKYLRKCRRNNRKKRKTKQKLSHRKKGKLQKIA